METCNQTWWATLGSEASLRFCLLIKEDLENFVAEKLKFRCIKAKRVSVSATEVILGHGIHSGEVLSRDFSDIEIFEVVNDNPVFNLTWK